MGMNVKNCWHLREKLDYILGQMYFHWHREILVEKDGSSLFWFWICLCRKVRMYLCNCLFLGGTGLSSARNSTGALLMEPVMEMHWINIPQPVLGAFYFILKSSGYLWSGSWWPYFLPWKPAVWSHRNMSGISSRIWTTEKSKDPVVGQINLVLQSE